MYCIFHCDMGKLPEIKYLILYLYLSLRVDSSNALQALNFVQLTGCLICLFRVQYRQLPMRLQNLPGLSSWTRPYWRLPFGGEINRIKVPILCIDSCFFLRNFVLETIKTSDPKAKQPPDKSTNYENTVGRSSVDNK